MCIRGAPIVCRATPCQSVVCGLYLPCVELPEAGAEPMTKRSEPKGDHIRTCTPQIPSHVASSAGPPNTITKPGQRFPPVGIRARGSEIGVASPGQAYETSSCSRLKFIAALHVLFDDFRSVCLARYTESPNQRHVAAIPEQAAAAFAVRVMNKWCIHLVEDQRCHIRTPHFLAHF